MNNLLLKSHESGRLDTAIDDEFFYIHFDVLDFLKKRNVVSASALVSFLMATPQALLTDDFMNQSEADYFRIEVLKLLKDLIVIRLPKKYSYGAVKPPENNGTN